MDQPIHHSPGRIVVKAQQEGVTVSHTYLNGAAGDKLAKEWIHDVLLRYPTALATKYVKSK